MNIDFNAAEAINAVMIEEICFAMIEAEGMELFRLQAELEELEAQADQLN